jgi:hypothetical protein
MPHVYLRGKCKIESQYGYLGGLDKGEKLGIIFLILGITIPTQAINCTEILINRRVCTKGSRGRAFFRF